MTYQKKSASLYRILVVEKDREIQELLSANLRSYTGARFEISSAFDITDAAQILSKSLPNAILLDLVLPDCVGVGALEKIVAFAPFLPIVVIASEADEQIALEAMRLGAQDYIVRSEMTGLLLARAVINAIERKVISEQLRTSLQEKEVLLREVHHRVKNNLQVICSLLSLASRTLENPLLQGVLEESKNRVLSMALVHDQLYRTRDFSAIDLGSYLESVVRSLWINILEAPEKVTLSFSLPCRPVDPDTAIACGLIVNELVTNALRYAFNDDTEGCLSVSLETSDDSNVCHLEVKDSGPGLSSEESFLQPKTLGFELVKVLTSQIDGHIEYRNDDGAVFTLSFATPIRILKREREVSEEMIL